VIAPLLPGIVQTGFGWRANFIAGPRICIGMGFAQMEATAVLAVLLSSLRLRLRSGYIPQPEAAGHATAGPRHADAAYTARLNRALELSQPYHHGQASSSNPSGAIGGRAPVVPHFEFFGAR
jgi:hypothetical protein